MEKLSQKLKFSLRLFSILSIFITFIGFALMAEAAIKNNKNEQLYDESIGKPIIKIFASDYLGFDIIPVVSKREKNRPKQDDSIFEISVGFPNVDDAKINYDAVDEIIVNKMLSSEFKDTRKLNNKFMTSNSYNLNVDSSIAVNVAYNKPVTSHFQTSYPAYRPKAAVESILSTFWASYITDVPQWLEVDLGQNYNLQCAHVYSAANAPNQGTVANFELQQWTGSRWDTIPESSITGNVDIGLSIEFTSVVNTNKIRFYSTDSTFIALRELAVFTGECPGLQVINPAEVPPPSVILVGDATGVRQGIMYILWPPISSALRYTLEVKINNGVWQLVSNILPHNLVLARANNGLYQFRVSACDQSQCGQHVYSTPYDLIMNQSPIALDHTKEINDVSTTIDLRSHVTDDGQINWSSLVHSQSETGTITGVAGAPHTVTLSYPAQSYSGTESFSFHVSDVEGLVSNDAVVNLVVNIDVNEPPQAGSTNQSISQNTSPTQVNLNQHITDDGLIDWSTLTFSQPVHGSVSRALGAPGVLLIDYAGVNYSGVDIIEYSITDVEGLSSNIGTITLQVNVVINQAPVANNLNININNNNTITTIDLAQYVQDDTGVAWSSLTFSSLNNGIIRYDTTRPSMLVIDYSGTDFIGTESIQYNVYDIQSLQSNTATISLNVSVVHNAPPVTQNLSQVINNDNRIITVNLSTFVTDDGGEINWQSLMVTQPAHGTVTSNNSSLLTIDFTNADYSGNDNFQYVVNDILGSKSNKSTVTLTVNALKNRPPVANDSNITISESNLTATLNLATVASDDFSIDWSTLQISSPQHGLLTHDGISSEINFDYRNTNYAGQELLTYSVKDNQGLQSNSGLITVHIDVSSIPPPPSNINVVNVSNTDDTLGVVNINWAEVADTRYDIQSLYNANGWQVVASNLTATQVNANQLLNGTHRFKVRACRVTVDLCSSYTVSSDHIIAVLPERVSVVTEPLIDANGLVNLSWQAAENTEYYQITQQIVGEQTWSTINAHVNATQLNFTLDSNNQYTFGVAACNSVGCASIVYSALATVSLSPIAPAIFMMNLSEQPAQLSWSGVAAADYYRLSQKTSSGSWQIIENALATTLYNRITTTNFVYEFQLIACNSFGCSTPIDATVTDPNTTSNAIVNYFYSDIQVLNMTGQSVQLKWMVTGAENINISDNQGNLYGNLGIRGALTLQPETTTEYTLNATDSHSNIQRQSIRIVAAVNNEQNPWQETTDDVYLTSVTTSILIDASGNRYFGDLQGNLHKVAMDGSAIWEPVAIGLISSQPVLQGNILYFTASTTNGSGKFCVINTDSSDLNCVSITQPIVAGPAISDVNQQAWVIDLYGGLSNINLVDLSVTTTNPLPQGTMVRSTPIITSSSSLVVLTTEQRLIRLEIGGNQINMTWEKDLQGGAHE